MGGCKLEGSTVSHPVHSCITRQIIELHVWTVIVWLVMHRITCLEYERMDFVFTEYFQCPIIKMDVMAIIEEHLGIYVRIASHRGKMEHGFMPTIRIRIS